MQHRDIIILKKIISEIEISQVMLGNANLQTFLADEKLKRATAMTVINIGELVKNITEETRLENPNIPWKAIAGMRDLAAHKYQTLRMEDVYQTVIADFPTLKSQLETMLCNCLITVSCANTRC